MSKLENKKHLSIGSVITDKLFNKLFDFQFSI